MKIQYRKKRYNFRLGLAALFSLLLVANSCFKLDEDVFSEVTGDNFVPTEDDVVALLAAGYTPLRFIMDWQGYFDLQEEPGDAIVTPTRPNGWDDGGVYKQMHFHTWNNISWQPQNTWETAFGAINSINRLLSAVEAGEYPLTEEQIVSIDAESRALRALWYSMLCDSHGNVPIVKKYSEELPTQNTRKEVYDFIISELKEVIPNLSSDVKSTYGRMNKWAAYHLLARMYLNAKVYTGSEEWENCITYCDYIIDGGEFRLADTYPEIFDADNEECPEIIFAVPYDNVYATNWNQHMKQLLPVHRYVFNMSAQPWGGSSANPQFIDTYDEDDKRFDATWLHGDQYHATADTVVITLVNKMPSIYDCEFNEGFRVRKYEIEDGCKSSMSNDVPYFRYTDVLMMKAECLLRTERSDDAAQLVSEIRARVFDDSEKATVTGSELEGNTTFQYGTLDENGDIDDPGDQSVVQYGRFLDELGWEFAAEFRRRTDMIRFGVYQTKNWYNHTPQGEHTILFPIALDILSTNSNLKQNPGYTGI